MFRNKDKIYTCTRIYVSRWQETSKKKLTLSVNKDLLEEVKLLAYREGRSVSSIVEEYFEYLVLTKWIDALADELGLGVLEPSTGDEIPKSRPSGIDAAKIVRELRDTRLRGLGYE